MVVICISLTVIFKPKQLAEWQNWYFAKIGAKTRFDPEEYSNPALRVVGLFLLFVAGRLLYKYLQR